MNSSCLQQQQQRAKYDYYHQYSTRSYGVDPVFTTTTASSGYLPLPKTVSTTTTTTRRYVINPPTVASTASSTRTTTSSALRTLSASGAANRQSSITNTISFQPLETFYNPAFTTTNRTRSTSLNRATKAAAAACAAASSTTSSSAHTSKSVMNVIKFPGNEDTATTRLQSQKNSGNGIVNVLDYNKIEEKICEQAKSISKILMSDKSVGTRSSSDIYMAPQLQQQQPEQQIYQQYYDAVNKNIDEATANDSSYLYLQNNQAVDSMLPHLPNSLSYDSYSQQQPQHQILKTEVIDNVGLISQQQQQQQHQQQQQQQQQQHQPVSSFTVAQNQTQQRQADVFPVNTGNANDYHVSVNIGNFNVEDINVQLVDDAEKDFKKLIVHCIKIEPVPNSAGNYLKKEFKREILMPNTIDATTLETYFFNDTLTFTCKYKQQQQQQHQQQQQALTHHQLQQFHQQVSPSYQPTAQQQQQANMAVNYASSSQHQQHHQQQQHRREDSTLSTSNNTLVTSPISYQTDQLLQQQQQQALRQSNSNLSNSSSGSNTAQTRSILKTSSQNPVQGVDPLIESILNSTTNNTSRSSSNTNVDQWTGLQRSNSQSKSVRFDEELNDKQTEEAQEYNSALYGVIRDGFSCITKDSLDNIYLTYFFKLPSCSPADRTQVKVENHSILRLKMTQEKKMKENNSTNSNNSASSSITTTTNAVNPTDDKIMFREFSRRCRLPTHLFKFDDTNVTVSFMNDVWVRVEIPIVEFLQQINQVNHDKLLQAHNNNNPVARDIISKTNQQQQQQQPPQQKTTVHRPSQHSNNSNNTLSTSELSSFSNSELISAQSEIRF